VPERHAANDGVGASLKIPQWLLPWVVAGAVLVVFLLSLISHTHAEVGVIVLGTLLLAIWAHGQFALRRQLALLADAMRRAGGGELGVRLAPNPDADWAGIAQAFNATMTNLERDRGLLGLRESELGQRNAALLSLREALDSHAIVSVTDIDGAIVFANDKFCKVSGYGADELVGRNHRLLKSGAHDAAFYRDLWRTIRSGRAWHGVLQNRRKDGGAYWVQSSILPVLDADGAPKQYISIRTDISARERLRTGLERLATAEHGPDLFLRIAQGISLGLDARLCGLSRLCPDGGNLEVVACWHDGEPVPGFTYPLHGSPCERAIDQKTPLVIEEHLQALFPLARALAAPGNESYRGLVLSGHDGAPLGVLWAINDRPAAHDDGEAALLAVAAKRASAELQRLEAESVLREQESRLALVISGAGLGVWDWDLVTGAVHMNDRWATMLGYEPGSIRPHIDSWRDLTHPDDHARAEQSIARHLAGQTEVYSEEVRLRARDGSWVWVLDNGRVTTRDAEGRPLRMTGIHLDITERKEAERALDAEHNRLELVIEAGSLGFWDWHVASDHVSVNDLLRQEFGAPAAGIDRMLDWFRLIHPDDRAGFRQATIDCLKGRHPVLKRSARWHTERGWVWIRTEGKVTEQGPDGRALRMMGVHSNIDEQRIAESRLREQEEHLRRVVDSAALGTWELDLVAGSVQINERLLGMLGYAPRSRIDQAELVALAHPQDLASIEAATRAHLVGREPFYSTEARLRCADGTWLWVLARGQVAQRDANGRATRLVGIHLDINERKQAEAALIAGEARFRVLVENVRYGIFLCDPQGEVVYANPPLERMYGISTREAGDTDWYALIHEDDRTATIAQWEALRAGLMTGFDAEFRLRRGDDDIRYVHSAAHAVHVDGRLMGFVGAVEDVTERKTAALQRDRLQIQLQQAQKMEALGQLTGGIAHDFNNILASILGYASLACSRYAGDNPKLTEYLNAVMTAGERARDLIAKMLAFSRNAPNESSVSMDVAPMVREVATMLASVIPSGIEIEVAVEPGVPRVNIGATDLHQVIVNLAVNARDAMGETGHLDITVRSVRCEREVCAACLEVVNGDYVEICCRDDGDGMDVDLLKRIFDPFFTTKEVGKGTGMGLSVVHGIVHRAGGHVLVESVKGVGTAFRLLLPAAQAASAAFVDNARVPGQVPPPVRGARVLLVDDEPMVLSFLHELLDGQGYRVELARDGAEALALLRERGQEFDLVITDQTMPHLSGVGLAKAARQLRPSLPVVLCTGYSDAVDIGSARRLGVQRFLRKPVETDTMLRVVAELVERRAVVS